MNQKRGQNPFFRIKGRRNMKKLLIMLSILFLFSITPVQAATENLDVYGEKMVVMMQVSQDGKVHVKTQTDVVFNEKRQGIFVSLPVKYEKYNFSKLTGNKEDDAKTYYFPISNFKSTSHKYEDMDNNDQGVVYRLGTEGVFLEGLNRFEYEYTIQTRDLKLKDQQEMFFMNIVGGTGEFPFKQTTFEIHFDKRIDGSLIQFETSLGDRDIDYTFDVQTNTIKGSYQKELGQDNALTVYIPLEKGYYNFPNLDFTHIAIIVGGLFSILIIVLRLRFTKHNPIITSVQFTAPPGLNSADVAMVYKGNLQSKDIVSLIIYWADKGFLNIVEHSKKSVELIKNRDLSQGSKEEIQLFEALFKDRETVFVDDLKNNFYVHINEAIARTMKRFTSNPEYKVYNSASQVILVVGLLVSFVYAILAGFVSHYSNVGFASVALIGAIITGIVSVVTLGLMVWIHSVSFKKNSMKLWFYLVALVGSMVLFAVAYFNDVNFVKAFLMSLIYLVLTTQSCASLQYTVQGSRWLGEILGLKRFIETTEIKRLKMFVEQTPHIFYNILPYAYVLGLNDLWAKKFETIAIQEPTWYTTTTGTAFNPYMMTRSLNRSVAVMNSNMSSVPESQSSSDGGFGSGGSSGGSSFGGGGFGGGGVGSW